MSDRPQPSDLQRQAALNNAAWCLAMWRAHGLNAQRQHGMVMCEGAPPRFYPNAVTIDPDADVAAQIEWLGKLAAAAPAGGVAVKDSFAALDLAGAGYRPLFEAQWIARDPGAAASPGLDWRLVELADDLLAWEVAWAGGEATEPRVFPPALLGDTGTGVMAGFDGEALVAGCVLSPTGPVVGLTNVFGDFAEAAAVAASMFPDRTLVGYERGDDLAAALAAGFRAVGPLTVWTAG
ncbi:MAG TPA: hypothetical protein VG939_16695 [Caulobacteraceae bacterium]|nr:hypothetical protein [Caulobacteraceae bacterium]